MYIGIGIRSVSADMKKILSVIYRIGRFKKWNLSVLIGIGRYEKKLIGRTLLCRYVFLLTGTPKGSVYLLFKRKLQKYSLWSLDAYHACVYIIQIYNLVGIALKYQIILQGAAASIHSNTCPLQNLGGFYLKKSSSKTLQLPNL